MKIALYAPENEYNQALFAALEPALAPDTLLRWLPNQPTPDPALDILLALGKVTADDLNSLPQLGLLQTVSDGYDAVDIDAATSLGIYVAFSPGDPTGNADSVAEFAVLLTLAAARRLKQALSFSQDTSLPKPGLNAALKGKHVCIVGLGDIGNKVADRLRPFGVHLSAVGHHPDQAPADIPTVSDLKTGVAHADFVILCVRGSKENEHLINAEVLAAMKQGASLINIARGTLVDEAALFESIHSGHLGGAGLDVLEHEPPAPGNPLLTLPTVVVTPHIAGFTDLNLAGTVPFLQQVVADYKAGKRFPSILNQPGNPRHPLR